MSAFISNTKKCINEKLCILNSFTMCKQFTILHNTVDLKFGEALLMCHLFVKCCSGKYLENLFMSVCSVHNIQTFKGSTVEKHYCKVFHIFSDKGFSLTLVVISNIFKQ